MSFRGWLILYFDSQVVKVGRLWEAIFMDKNDLGNLWPESPASWSILMETSIDTLLALQGPEQQLQVLTSLSQFYLVTNYNLTQKNIKDYIQFFQK